MGRRKRGIISLCRPEDIHWPAPTAETLGKLVETVLAEKQGTNASGQAYTYRVVQRQYAHVGRRQYWVQLSRPDLPWQDVWGPYFQRLAALRKLETY